MNLQRGAVNEDQAKKVGKWLQGTEIAVTFPEEAQIFLSSEMCRPALGPTRLQINVNKRLLIEGKAAEA
jgi:hypothetical protein